MEVWDGDGIGISEEEKSGCNLWERVSDRDSVVVVFVRHGCCSVVGCDKEIQGIV